LKLRLWGSDMAVTWKKLAYENNVVTKAFLSAKGDLLYANPGGTIQRLPIGTDNQILAVNVDLPNWEAAAAGSFHKARSYLAGAQNVLTATFTKVLIDTDSFDPSNITDLVNHRIIPNQAGYYHVVGQVAFTTFLASTFAMLYFNGAIASYGDYIGSAVFAVTHDLIYFNGSSNYVELWCYQGSGSTQALSLSPERNFLVVFGPF